MSNELLHIFLLSLLAMFNPSLLAAVTVLLLLPSPKRLMVGYLLGAYTTSITVGLVIVFTLPNSGATSTAKHTVSPIEDLVVGLLVPSSAVANQQGMRAGCHLCTDLLQVLVHRLGIDSGHDDCRAGRARVADRTEDVDGVMAVVAHHRRT